MGQRVIVIHESEEITAELIRELATHGVVAERVELNDETTLGEDKPAAVLFDFSRGTRGELLLQTIKDSGVIAGVLTDALDSDSRVLMEMGADLVLGTNTPPKWIASSVARHLQEENSREIEIDEIQAASE